MNGNPRAEYSVDQRFRRAAPAPVKTGFRFYGISPPFPDESANSFLQRLGQRYDLSFPQLKEALGVEWLEDPDVLITLKGYKQMARVCGLSLDDFDAMLRLDYSINFNSHTQHRIRYGSCRRPLYEYCVQCWREDTVPYLRTEWRIGGMVCFRHQVLMAQGCPNCNCNFSLFHKARLVGLNSRARHLAQCYWCGFDLRRGPEPKSYREFEMERKALARLGPLGPITPYRPKLSTGGSSDGFRLMQRPI